jgi:hypothetical protein
MESPSNGKPTRGVELLLLLFLLLRSLLLSSALPLSVVCAAELAGTESLPAATLPVGGWVLVGATPLVALLLLQLVLQLLLLLPFLSLLLLASPSEWCIGASAEADVLPAALLSLGNCLAWWVPLLLLVVLSPLLFGVLLFVAVLLPPLPVEVSTPASAVALSAAAAVPSLWNEQLVAGMPPVALSSVLLSLVTPSACMSALSASVLLPVTVPAS